MNLKSYHLMSSMFSNQQTTSSLFGGGMLNFNFSDWNNIRNGTYSKLMHAYYDKSNSSDDDKSSKRASAINSAASSTSTAKATDKDLADVQEKASELTDSAQALYKNSSLFRLQETKGEDGKVTKDYNRDGIYKKITAFIEDYNALMKSASGSKVKNIANTATNMATATHQYSKLLSNIGITIDSSNNTLSIDKEKFMSANMSDVKSLFSGTGSFAYSAASKASMINSYAKTEASKANTYLGSGGYSNNYSSGNIFNSYF